MYTLFYEEIKRIVHGVYSKSAPLKHGKTEIHITKNELLNIREIGGVARKTLYYLYIHSKRYADENGEFFMTYNQLIEAGNYSKSTAINYIKGLEKQNAIEVTRSPLQFNNEKSRNLPNKYKLINLDFKMIKDEQNKSVSKNIYSTLDYNTIAHQALNELFTYIEWLGSDYHAI